MSGEDTAILNAFYDNFLKLTEIPRPSHHEEKISKFLLDWATEKGYEAHQDDVMNVIFDVPATSGKEDLVESSSNLGLFSLSADGSTFTAYERSSVAEKQTEIVESETSLAEENGFTVTTEKAADPWSYDPDNELMGIASDVYQELNGTEFDLIALHAGLECGTYAVDNPDLQMISIGADIENEHTPNETLYLNSVPKLYKLLRGILLKVE